ncbi:MAG: hypothetical protein ACTSP7_14115 [Candidatus Heimdallarchaeota archaeon]
MSEDTESEEPIVMSDEALETPRKEKFRSVGVMASYGVGKFQAEFFTGAFGALVFYFNLVYELGWLHLD